MPYMTEEPQVQASPESAASEPAAPRTDPIPHPFAPKPEPAEAPEADAVEGAGASAPASDDAPDQETPEPASDEDAQQQTDWEARFKELEEKITSEFQPKLSEYEQWQQQQAAAAERQRREAMEQQWAELRKSQIERLMAVDSTEEAEQIFDGFMQQVLGSAQQRFQSEIQRLQQQHQQEYSQFEQQLSAQLTEVYKPAFADSLIAEHGLPAEFRDHLLSVPDPDQMPQIAELLKQTLAQSAPQVQQQVAHQRAEQHRANNTFAPSEGGQAPPPRGFEPMRAQSKESLTALGQILGGQR